MDYRARHPYFRSIIISFALLSATAAYADSPIAHQITLPTGMNWCDDTMINGLFSQINSFRSQNGAAPLGMSTLGMKDAEIRATQFALYMATATPGAPGFNPHQGYDTTAASLGYNLVSENLAYISTDPAYIVGGIWQDSLHLAALLAAGANVMGVSCVYYNGIPFWTYEPGSCSGCSSTPTPTPTPTPAPSGTPTLDSEEWAFLTLINNFRAQNGLGALQVSVGLENAAKWMSGDMAAKNYFSHTDSLGRSTGTRLAALGYPYSPWGENLAAGYADAQSAFTGWLNACDPDGSGNCTYAHRQNMLGAGYKVIGIARAFGSGSSYGWYWATDFGGFVDQVITGGSTPPSPAPSIVSFGAAPSTITAGQTATLSWNVTGATSVTIDN
ncbi:MAG TPA: CAP domain-containing protein, partial [Bryobacteraceae bacterium]